MPSRNRLAVAFFLLCFGVFPLRAELARIVIRERGDVLAGKPFGATGPYEFLRGEFHYEIDPASADTEEIPDLKLAERNAQGKVAFRAAFELLRPKDPGKSSGALLYDVVNRGERTVLGVFSRGMESASPAHEARYGDGLLFEQGYSVLWSGWQYDVDPETGRIGLEVPVVRSPDGPITGLVRSEFIPRVAVTSFLVSHPGHRPIEITRDAAAHAKLTVRDASDSPRREIPRTQWRAVDGSRIEMAAGFLPGKIYELVYPAQDPKLGAAGYLAVRDALSAMKYKAAAASALLGGVEYEHVYAFGNSQSAMFLRSFLYRGFNADAQGRPVLDAVFSSVAGARSVRLKERFAQPSQTAAALRALFYPSDLFPHSDLPQTDPVTGRTAGLLVRARQQSVAPKIFHINSAYEYYGCGASLVHASLDGRSDLPLPENVRVYMFAGGQHGPGRFPPRQGRAQNLSNHNDYHWAYRALLVALDRWVRGQSEPPPSRYPRIDQQTLVSLDQLDFPALPDVETPRRIHVPRRLDFGRSFDQDGIVEHQPPAVSGQYVALVPQVDADGNDIAGVRMPQIAVPLGTYTGWNLRAPAIGAPHELLDSAGSFLPFAASRVARESTGDPRRSIVERYGSRGAYLDQYRKVARQLANDGFLLLADLEPITQRATALWDWVVEGTTQPVVPSTTAER